MSKVHRIFSLCIVFVLLFTLTASAATSYSEANNAGLPEQISSETVITEDNIYDVLEYVGLDSSAFIKTDKPNINTNIVTVGDLEKAIEKVNQMPHTITDTPDIPDVVDPAIERVTTNVDIKGYPTKTVSQNTTYSSYTMRYSATGEYYTEPYPPHNAFWMKALGGNIEVQSCNFPLTVIIEEIRSLTNTLYNSGTTNSYLKLAYDYTVGIYTGVEWGLIKTGENDISGYTIFNTSYL